MVRLYSEPVDSAVLTLRNEAQAELWRRDGKQEHFGCCTRVQEDKNNDGKPDYALWSGALRATATYYIVIEPARTVTQPVRYRSEINRLEAKRLPDAGFPAEERYYRTTGKRAAGYSLVDWGGVSQRQMNPWVTVDALFVLRLAGRLE